LTSIETGNCRICRPNEGSDEPQSDGRRRIDAAREYFKPEQGVHYSQWRSSLSGRDRRSCSISAGGVAAVLETREVIPLPAATQWEIVEELRIRSSRRDELIRQAAQGTVVHNDDTGMRVLMLPARSQGRAHWCVHQRHRVCWRGTQIALYFTEAACRRESCEVLKKRSAELPARFKCAMLCRAMCRSCLGVEILLANCLRTDAGNCGGCG